MADLTLRRPERPGAKSAVKAVVKVDEALGAIIRAEAAQRESVRSAADQLRAACVRKTLEELEIEQLNRDKSGIRLNALVDAGVTTVAQAVDMSLQELIDLKGVGEQSAYKIKAAVNRIVQGIEQTTPVRISADNPGAWDKELVNALFTPVNGAQLRSSVLKIFEASHSRIIQQAESVKIAFSSLRWSFASKENKRAAAMAFEQLMELADGEYCIVADELLRRYDALVNTAEGDRWNDFLKRAPLYYTALENLTAGQINLGAMKNGLPAQLAQVVEEYPINTGLMKATLRSYQQFGTKYILSQGNALLGDEMGLGKTVQAIAAMASLAEDGQKHFMVVCPAGVLVNWCREVEQHSQLHSIKLHGDLTAPLNKWVREGGVIVTTFETASRFSLPGGVSIALLVVDEAHYIKNPYTIRTRAVMGLMERTQRTLFMTGTPLENRVDEMCFLVKLLRPELADELEQIKYFSSAPQFRETLAPVYLRRTREEVLQELPELIEKEEWCDMGSEETMMYEASVASGNFMAMRQVSWQIQNVKNSVKAQRLLEICEQAAEQQRKVIVFSFFRETLAKVQKLLGERCLEPVTGSVPPAKRQQIIDAFTAAPNGTVLVCQVQAGGTGLNIQTASVVVFCEPQIKPSIETQAISRAYRMGQVRSVLVHRLLCEDTVDEHIIEMLRDKQDVFDSFAEESVVGKEHMNTLSEKSWIDKVVSSEQARIAGEEG